MALVSSDFFEEDEFSGWGGSKTESLNAAWLERLRQQPDPEHSDVDVAVALMDLVHTDLLLFGTSGGESLADEEIPRGHTDVTCRHHPMRGSLQAPVPRSFDLEGLLAQERRLRILAGTARTPFGPV